MFCRQSKKDHATPRTINYPERVRKGFGHFRIPYKVTPEQSNEYEYLSMFLTPSTSTHHIHYILNSRYLSFYFLDFDLALVTSCLSLRMI